jgi:hypothetical protein
LTDRDTDVVGLAQETAGSQVSKSKLARASYVPIDR